MTNIEHLRERVENAHTRISDHEIEDDRQHEAICARLEILKDEVMRGTRWSSIIGSIIGSGGIIGIIQLVIHLMQQGGQ